MGGFSLVHWLIFAVVAIVVLGGGRFSSMMGDVAKGIKNFKKGMSEEEEATAQAARLDTRPIEPAPVRDAQAVREDR